MGVKVGYCTPMLHVTSIERSIGFYEQLGFSTIDTDRGRPLGWARLHCEGGALMFVRGGSPLHSKSQSVVFYMYTPDLEALSAELAAKGIHVPPASYPEYMRGGEICLKDPDGYTILVGHWGKAEQQEWEKRIGASP